MALLLAGSLVLGMGVTGFAASKKDDDDDREISPEFGIDYAGMDNYTMVPGQLYAFDLITEDGYLMDDDWKDAHSITWDIISGKNTITEFYIDRADDSDNYQLFINTDPNQDYTNDKTIKFKMRAKNTWRDEDDKRGEYYGEAYRFEAKLKVGYGKSVRNKIKDDYFEVEPRNSAVTLDKDLVFVTAAFKNVGYLDFTLKQNYQYIFAYNNTVPKELIHANPDNYLEAWNFTAKPVLDAPGKLSYIADSKRYVYKLNEDGTYTQIPSTYSNTGRVNFTDKELGYYIFAQKPLKNVSLKAGTPQNADKQTENHADVSNLGKPTTSGVPIQISANPLPPSAAAPMTV